VPNVEALQCHPKYAFMGGGASDGLNSMVSQKVLDEKQRITYQKHLALSSPSARSVARVRSTKKIYTFIYRSIVLHCFYRGEIVYLFKICGFPLVVQQTKSKCLYLCVFFGHRNFIESLISAWFCKGFSASGKIRHEISRKRHKIILYPSSPLELPSPPLDRRPAPKPTVAP